MDNRFSKPCVVGIATSVAACFICGSVQAQPNAYGTDNTATMLTVYLGIAAIAILFYLIPTFVAFWRKHPNRWLIAVINIAFGGTVIGWFGALVWAMSAAHLSPTGSNGGESGLNIFANDPVTVRLSRHTEPAAPAVTAPMVEPTFNPSAGSTTFMKPAAVGTDIIDQLERLTALRSAGSLSDEDFASFKSALLQQGLTK